MIIIMIIINIPPRSALRRAAPSTTRARTADTAAGAVWALAAAEAPCSRGESWRIRFARDGGRRALQQESRLCRAPARKPSSAPLAPPFCAQAGRAPPAREPAALLRQPRSQVTTGLIAFYSQFLYMLFKPQRTQAGCTARASPREPAAFRQQALRSATPRETQDRMARAPTSVSSRGRDRLVTLA